MFSTISAEILLFGLEPAASSIFYSDLFVSVMPCIIFLGGSLLNFCATHPSRDQVSIKIQVLDNQAVDWTIRKFAQNASYFYLHLYTHKNWPNVGIDIPYTLSIINWNPPGSWLRLNRFSTHGFQPVGNPEDWSLAETLIRAWKTFLGMWVCWKIQIASYPWIFCITYNCTLFI